MEAKKDDRRWFMRFNAETGAYIGDAFARGPVEGFDDAENWIACDQEQALAARRGARFAPGLDGALNRVEVPREERVAAAKARRNALLDTSDWTQTDDAKAGMSEEKRAAWTKYRQALRDVPQQAGFPDAVSWPERPL